MTFVLPPGAAPWWAVTILAVVGAGVGAWLTRVLADAGYRRPEEWDQPLPRHTWWLVIAVAVAWASLTFRFGGQAQWSLLPAYLYLGAIGAALTLIDLDVHRLPDLIVLPSYPIAFVLLLVPTVVTGQWGALLRGVLAALALFVGYLVLFFVSVFVSPGGLGLGDVKLAGVLGLFLGWLGWGPALISVFAAFIIGGVISLVMVLTRAALLGWRASLKTSIAFGPSMILGAWVAVIFPVHVLTG
ncbi:MAG: A24 family peptidase [Dermatophilaceae bacterium]